ncbi:delta-12-fatty acid desaturase [Phycomyces nitens]|nr:delta-12-fatty acid desaturase [Phycomyces nitens]
MSDNTAAIKEEKKPLNLEEAVAKGWEIPDFTIKEIRDAIPAHCFRIDTFRSFGYVLHDFIFVALLMYGASKIDTLSSPYIRFILWTAYSVLQGIVGTGLWVIGHECGHQSFSSSKTINDSVGIVIHSLLLVPYYSWKISHSKHHKSNGHLYNDMVYVPRTRSHRKLVPRDQDPEVDGPHSALMESPIVETAKILRLLLIGWPSYVLLDVAGKRPKTGWVSHFNFNCHIFEEHHYLDFVKSNIGISIALSALVYAGRIYGAMTVMKYYLFPYLTINCWLVLITYLQHTDSAIPRYSPNVWNFQRGAALTVDRSYGPILNHFHHHICDTHVAHHFFSNMPHYHAVEATKHIKKVLGKHYMFDDTPIVQALYRSYRECKFIEDEGDVRFLKN